MAKIIRAICTTASADDTMGRVKLKSEGVWNQETELVPSLNGCALNKNDVVYVSVEDSYYNPLILGKADRNNIVLNLLVDRVNILEDKVNELIDKQNDVINALATKMLATGEGVVWNGAVYFGSVPTPDAGGNVQVQVGPIGTKLKKTTLKDIEDNYK